jgi:hypothetical protein
MPSVVQNNVRTSTSSSLLLYIYIIIIENIITGMKFSKIRFVGIIFSGSLDCCIELDLEIL